MFSLGACDASQPDATEIAHTGAVASSLLPGDRGPALSAFPASTLLSMSAAEALLADSTALRTSTGDTLVLVPLVFDSADSLHSPESFRELLIAIRAQTTFPINPTVYFTDLAVFDSVIATTGTAESGRSHVQVYAQGEQGRIAVAGHGASLGAVPAFAEVYDPYVIPEVPPPPCNPGDEGCGGGGGGGGRPTNTTHYGLTPSWPALWKGDVITGDTENGGGSFGSLGHTALITELDNAQNEGGDITDSRTKVMEAIGEQANVQDEVIQRPARTYWIDEGSRVNHVKVRYNTFATWAQRNSAIAYARAQDPDDYGIFTNKWDDGKWYCSKLIWRAYMEATGHDLDANGGYWVLPSDIGDTWRLTNVYHFIFDPS